MTQLATPICCIVLLLLPACATRQSAPPSVSSPPTAASSATAPAPVPAAVTLTGSPGAVVHGFYIADGNRSDFAAALPLTLRVHGISLLAVAKSRSADEVILSATAPRGSMRFTLAANDDHAAIATLADGFSCSLVSASAVTPPSRSALVVIKPYWHEGTWVFDDPAVGLSREPFVSGVPEMINFIVKDIPSAKAGFRATGSENPFPGYQHKLTWLRADSGGNYYRLEGTPLEGWLCPAMFRYFDHTPKTLYLKAEPLSPNQAPQ